MRQDHQGDRQQIGPQPQFSSEFGNCWRIKTFPPHLVQKQQFIANFTVILCRLLPSARRHCEADFLYTLLMSKTKTGRQACSFHLISFSSCIFFIRRSSVIHSFGGKELLRITVCLLS